MIRGAVDHERRLVRREILPPIDLNHGTPPPPDHQRGPEPAPPHRPYARPRETPPPADHAPARPAPGRRSHRSAPDPHQHRPPSGASPPHAGMHHSAPSGPPFVKSPRSDAISFDGDPRNTSLNGHRYLRREPTPRTVVRLGPPAAPQRPVDASPRRQGPPRREGGLSSPPALGSVCSWPRVSPQPGALVRPARHGTPG